MKLGQRLREGRDARVEPASFDGQTPEGYQEVKSRLHTELVDGLDLAQLEQLEPEKLRAELRSAIAQMMTRAPVGLNRIERERLIQELIDEMTGLGPLEPLLADPTVTEILVNGHDTVYLERDGKLQPGPARFRDDDHLMQIINRIVNRIGRRVDETCPMVDARLPDGSRVNAIIPPLAIDGPALSIRRFGVRPLRANDLVASGSIDRDMLAFLSAAVRAKLNVLISGGTGTGKTTLLNILSAYIPEEERIITNEDAGELQLQQRHVVRLETRPANVEGTGGIFQRELVRNSLRMRPDRIIVGEVRGAEVLDMLQAMNTGHEGSMTTIHSNSPRDALNRLVSMMGMAGIALGEQMMTETLARALDLIVQIERGRDGKRRVTSVSEITGTEGSVIVLQDIFRFHQQGIDEQGEVLGHSAPTGVRPQCLERIERAGYSLQLEYAA